MRVRHQGADPGEVDRVHRVHRDRVPGPAVAAGPRVGPQLGPKPVQVLDQFARPQRQSEALRFSPGMKQVRASMTFHTPLMRQMCPRGVYLCSTFQPSDDDETRKCKARELARRSDTAFAAWKEKQISDGVKGIEERDQMVNDYMDGKRKPKNPDPLGPPISYMEECGVFQPLASTTNTLGLCHFYHRTLTRLCLQVQSHRPLQSM